MYPLLPVVIYALIKNEDDVSFLTALSSGVGIVLA